MAVLTKRELAEQLRKVAHLSLTKAVAVDIVETVMDLIVCHFQEGGEKVVLRGFGAFKIRERCAFTGSHPGTGERIVVAPKRSIAFKPSAEVVRRINN